MVLIREVGGGRFEVYAAERHWEAFDGTLGALMAAQGLANQIAAETGRRVTIRTPWGDKQVSFVGDTGDHETVKAETCVACI